MRITYAASPQVGWEIIRIDEFIDELLTSDYACDIALPRLPKRWHLEDAKMLEPRSSLAEDDLDSDPEDNEEVPVSELRETAKEVEPEPSSGSLQEIPAVVRRSAFSWYALS